jgi:hypothetical protein
MSSKLAFDAKQAKVIFDEETKERSADAMWFETVIRRAILTPLAG